MACRISELILDCNDPELLAAFWCEVLGHVELGREPDGGIEIGPPATGFGSPLPTLILSPTTDPRPSRLPLHLDASPTDRDQAAELARLLALGAKPADVGQTGQEPWHVLADPNTPDSQFWSESRCRPPPLPVTSRDRPTPTGV
ncbi:VOC family protein [Kitasatospora sp. NPDC059795]|uniref:VOC family protein n=1 Tax=Kitasatospora sp. NPDC059795 TaxID=3346949 RepID=UPI003668E206